MGLCCLVSLFYHFFFDNAVKCARLLLMKIQKCTCKHEFQDQEYGKGKRAMNAMKKIEGGHRCTVCGKEYGKNTK